MKIRNFGFLFLAVSFLMVSCGDDEVCDVLVDNIPGTWEVSSLGDGDFTLAADGTMTESGTLIFDGTLSAADKTWTLAGSLLTLEANDGSQITSIEFDVETFDCNTLNAKNDGNDFTISRK